MSRFKAGDLALVIGDSHVPSNIGNAVELIECVTPGSNYTAPDGQLCENCTDISVWIVKGNGVKSCEGGHGWCQKAESNLMPLRGDFTPEEMRDMEKEHA